MFWVTASSVLQNKQKETCKRSVQYAVLFCYLMSAFCRISWDKVGKENININKHTEDFYLCILITWHNGQALWQKLGYCLVQVTDLLSHTFFLSSSHRVIHQLMCRTFINDANTAVGYIVNEDMLIQEHLRVWRVLTKLMFYSYPLCQQNSNSCWNNDHKMPFHIPSYKLPFLITFYFKI